MALDLGSKTIGLAIADTGHQIATPFDTIRRKKFALDAAQLADIIAREDIGGLVVGLPLNMDGSKVACAGDPCLYPQSGAIGRLSPLPVLLWDERLSTAAVERTLLAADTSRAKRATVIDKMAAAFILQGVLDYLNN